MQAYSSTEQEAHKVAWIILEAAQQLRVGAYKLAEFLRGSKAKDIAMLSSQRLYGGLLWLNMDTILNCIKQLEKRGYLARKSLSGDPMYPILELSDIGKKVMEQRFPIDLDITRIVKPIHIGNSERETFRMVRNGLTLQDVSQQRSLAISTIYNHAFRLIALGYLSSSEIIPQHIIGQVVEASKAVDTPTASKLKPLLPESISYEEIRCVLVEVNRVSEIKSV